MSRKVLLLICVLLTATSPKAMAWTAIDDIHYNLSFEHDSDGEQMYCSTRVGCPETWDPNYVSHCGVMAWKENEVNWPIVEMECSQSAGGDDCECHVGIFASDGICDLTLGQWSAADTNLIVWQSLDPAYDSNVIIKPDYEYRITFDSFRWQENYLTFYFYYGNISDNNSTNPDVSTIAEFEVVVGVEPWETVTYSFIAEPDQPYIGKPLGLRFYQRGQGWHWVDNIRIDMGAYEYIPPLVAQVRISPNSLNLQSKGRWVSCYIVLPEDYNVADIDPNSVLLENEIEANSLQVNGQVAIVKFSRSEAQDILEAGELELTVSGELADGTIFEGTDTITVIDRGGPKPAKYQPRAVGSYKTAAKPYKTN